MLTHFNKYQTAFTNKFNAIGLTGRITAFLIAGAFALIFSIALIAYLSASQILRAGIEDQFQEILETRKASLETWFTQQEASLLEHARNPTIKNALYRIDTAWSQTGTNVRETLTDVYVTNNPHPVGERHLFDKPDGRQAYHRFHGQFHPYFRELMEHGNYYDIFLINLNGDVIYTVFKEVDFATNLVDGEWAETGLGRVFRAARDAEEGVVVFDDFVEYAPSNDLAAAFFATKVMDKSGNPAGVLVHQVPSDVLTGIMRANSGMGALSRATLVGQDWRQRNSNDPDHPNDILAPVAETESLAIGLADESSRFQVESDVHGDRVFVKVVPYHHGDTIWALRLELPLSYALAPVRTLQITLLIVAVVLLAIVSFFGLRFGHYLTAPVLIVQKTISAIRSGQLEDPVAGQDRGDEFGALAGDVEDLRVQLKKAAEQAQEKQLLDQERQRTAMDQDRVVDELSQAITQLEQGNLSARLDREFPAQYEVLRTGLNNAITRLNQVISTFAQSAESIDSSAIQIDGSMNEVRDRVGNQASELDETATTLSELTRLVSETAQNTVSSNQAMQSTIHEATNNGKVVDEASQIMDQIQHSAGEVSNVIALIEEIALQTNLLALNASVEAARAGPEGRGFAVVATEVRALSTKTAEAVSKIDQMLEQNNSVIAQGSDRVARVSDFFNKLNEDLNKTSSSIEAISQAAQDQSSSIAHIDQAVARLGSMTQDNVSMIRDVHDTGTHLANEAAKLRKTSSLFKTSTLKTATKDKSFDTQEPDSMPASAISTDF